MASTIHTADIGSQSGTSSLGSKSGTRQRRTASMPALSTILRTRTTHLFFKRLHLPGNPPAYG